MSDDEELEMDGTSEYSDEQRLTFRHQTPDPMLAAFVVAGERAPNLWLTVLVGGVWITGRVVHYADWLAALALDDPESPLRDKAAMEEAQEQGDPMPIEERKHLHLFDAEMMTSAGIVSPVGAPFRARLVAVDAWLVGRLGATVRKS